MTHLHWKRTVATLGIGLSALLLSACESEPVAVPDLVGIPANEARDELRDTDFGTSMRALDGSFVVKESDWVVESTDPAAGEMVDPKTEITVNVIRPEEEEPEAEDSASDFEFEYHDEHESAVVRFQVRDNFSRGLIASGAHTDTVKALEAANNEYPEAQQITVIGTFPDSDTIMMDPYYERETIDRIDFKNALIEDIWAIRDGGAVHNDLLENK